MEYKKMKRAGYNELPEGRTETNGSIWFIFSETGFLTKCDSATEGFVISIVRYVCRSVPGIPIGANDEHTKKGWFPTGTILPITSISYINGDVFAYNIHDIDFTLPVILIVSEFFFRMYC